MTNTAAAVRFVGRDIYYGWVVLGVAALAMVGTLPGRTQGLGLITEPLLADLGVSRVQFAQINFVATLIGSLFVGIGALVDRRGSRMVLTALAVLLGAVVVAMSRVHGAVMLLVLITLTRGLGQSALSVVSLAMPGKWFRRRLTWAMAVYAVVMSLGFMMAFPIVGSLVLTWGWRATWAAIGAALILGLAPVAWALVRPEPATNRELEVEDAAPSDALTGDWTLGATLRSPAFWVFGVASAMYGLVASGIGLFNESILATRGFAPGVYHQALAVTAITGLAGNFAAGAWADRGSLRRVLVAALVLLTGRPDRLAAREHSAARDGAGGGDGGCRRLRDGGVLQFLGPDLRPAAPRTNPGGCPGADRPGVGDRAAHSGLVGGSDRILRRCVLRGCRRARPPDRRRGPRPHPFGRNG